MPKNEMRGLLFLFIGYNSMKSTSIERSVCQKCLEPIVFRLWSFVAGKPNPKKVLASSNSEEVLFSTMS